MKLSTFEAVVEALNQGRVPFILVGGVAVAAHGYGRLTHDLDLVIQLQPRVIEDAFKALASLGYRPRVPVTAAGFADPRQRQHWIDEKGMKVLNFQSDLHRETPIDVFVSEPFDFEQEYDSAVVQEIGPGLPVHIVRLETLLRLKSEAGRPQDLADIAELQNRHRKPS